MDAHEGVATVVRARKPDTERSVGPAGRSDNACGVDLGVDRRRHFDRGRTRWEAEGDDPLGSSDVERRTARGELSGGEGELSLLGGLRHVNLDVHEALGSELSAQNGDVRELRRDDTARDVVELTVEQLPSGESRRIGDSCDRIDRVVDLQLVGGDLVVGKRAAVGRFDEQRLDVGQERLHLVESAFRRGDHVDRSRGVVDRLLDDADLRAQTFGYDQPGGIVGTAVDPQSAGESLQRKVEGPLGISQVSLSDQRRDVTVDTRHEESSLITPTRRRVARDMSLSKTLVSVTHEPHSTSVGRRSTGVYHSYPVRAIRIRRGDRSHPRRHRV